MVRAVLFDLDGVLMETELQTFRFYQDELKRRYDITLSNDAFRFKAGRKSADFWRDALNDEQRRTVDTTALTRYKREHFGATPSRYISRVQGGPELLAVLRQTGVPLALASQNEPFMINAAVDW
ncbi:MAG: HAD hydrolase-like protein, partial [bacterium]|nr:HAD hydrolase-like protein [bacterium]